MGMSDTELQRAVGQRMRAAAEAKGLNQVEVADLVETAQSTISRWWSGDQRPDNAAMATYARQLGVSEAWLLTGEEVLTPARLADAVTECLLRVQRGEAPSGAFDSMTNEPWHMTPEERRRVDAAAGRLRELVATSVPEWDDLSDWEQRQALRQLLAPQL